MTVAPSRDTVSVVKLATSTIGVSALANAGEMEEALGSLDL